MTTQQRPNVSRRTGAPVRIALVCLAVGLVASACGPEFAPYNEVSDFRVLAVRADIPWLAQGQVATLDALVYTPSPDDEVTYQWSWCPFPTSSSDGNECALTQEELQEIVDEAVAQIPDIPEGVTFQVPPFDLGTEPSVQFPYPAPAPFIEGLCQQLQNQDLPDFVSLPDCSKGLPVSVRLVAKSGDKEIITVKEVQLVYEPGGEQNQNPVINDVVAKPLCVVGGDKTLCPADFPGFPLASTEDAIPFYRDVLYRLELAIPDEASETFVPTATEDNPDPEPQREDLSVTWFIQGGDLDFTRTGFIEGEDSGVEAAATNDWETPLTRDYDDETMKLFFVIRDGRGGINWIEREIRFTDGSE